MVREVEELGAERYPVTFRDSEILEPGDVPVLESGVVNVQAVAILVSEGARGRRRAA